MNRAIREIVPYEVTEFIGQEPSPDGQPTVIKMETPVGQYPAANRKAQVCPIRPFEVIHHESESRLDNDSLEEYLDIVPG